MSNRGPLMWTRLHLPSVVLPEQARAAVQAVAGLSGQPRIVLEAVGQQGRVTWWLSADEFVLPRILRAIAPHLPGLRTDGLQNKGVQITAAVGVRLPGHRQSVRLRSASAMEVNRRTVDVGRSLLGALSAADASEIVLVQLVLGPRHRPHVVGHDRAPLLGTLLGGTPAPNRQPSATAISRAEHRFGCELRIGADASTTARTRSLIEGVVGALRGLESPGVRVALRRTSAASVAKARSPYLWSLDLSVSEVVMVLGWPVASDLDAELPGVPSRYPKLLPVVGAVPRLSGGRPLGVSTLDPFRPVALSVQDSLRHLHLLGPTGVGKSTLMAQLALGDIQAGRGTVVIDPKGDLVEELLGRVPAHRQSDVVVLDPTDSAPVGIQTLGGRTLAEADLSADVLLSVFHSLYADAWGPRTHDILHACLLTLARRSVLMLDSPASLVMVPLLLTNPGFRRSVFGRVVKADPLGLGSFWAWFDGISEAERTQAIAPLMNKLRPVLLRPGLRAVFGQRAPKFQLSDVFSQRRMLLVSLAKGTLGPEAAQLLGSVTVALLWQAAQARAAVPAHLRHPVMVHIDEVQDYLRLGDIGEALTQARGLAVGFTLAHQHLGQLPKSVREAVLANARSRVVFQTTGPDATALATATRGLLEPADFESLPAFHAYARLLVGGRPAPWCSLATTALPDGDRATARRMADAVRSQSARQYGQALDEVERDLLSLSNAGTANVLGDSSEVNQESGQRTITANIGRQRPAAGSPGDRS